MTTNGRSAVQKGQDLHLLKLVAQSFCKELAAYGANENDIVNISIQLLDHVIRKRDSSHDQVPAPASGFLRAKISGAAHAEGGLCYGRVGIRPMQPVWVPIVAEWLVHTDVQMHFPVLFPGTVENLQHHLFEVPSNRYFGIFYDETFVGMIGAEHIDRASKKLEMKKFIGVSAFRERGVGKAATFLWLHYVFDVLDFNKVYIYSLDTNIRNINLNSKLGFELEGVLFEDLLMQGTHRDVIRMALLRSKWRAMYP